MTLKQGEQGSDHVLVVVHNKNTGAVRHDEKSYVRAAGIVVKSGASVGLAFYRYDHTRKAVS
jgi:hypothetical protein